MFSEVNNGDNVTTALDAWENTLNEIYGTVNIAGLTFDTSRIIRELDPIAYRCYFYDWLDSEGVDSDTLTGDDSRLS
jgi:hypothetical protein